MAFDLKAFVGKHVLSFGAAIAAFLVVGILQSYFNFLPGYGIVAFLAGVLAFKVADKYVK